jgi:hypothetical protein
MSALGNPSVVRFACNGFVSTTTDSNSQTQVAGKLRLYFQSGGTTGLTGTFEDLIVCNSRTVTVTGIPAGGMIRVGGVGGVTSAAESGGTCTVVMTEQTMPAQLEVLDSGSTVLESSSGVVYGGDTFNFVAANFAALTMGGGQVVVAGTVSESGPLAAVMGGASAAIVGFVEIDGVAQMTSGGASMSGVIGHFVDNLYPLGRREVTADFSGIHSSNVSVTKRPDAISFDYLTAFSSGPSGIGNVLAGITNRSWRVRADNVVGRVWLAKANDTNTAWEAETLLFSFTGTNIEEIDLAFDQSGNAVVCVERNSGAAGAKQVWLYWFKPSAGTFVLEMIEGGRTPRLLLDNPPDAANSDVTLFYLKTGVGVVYRVQRELYAAAHATPHVQEADWYIEDAFYTKGWRVAVFLVQHNTGGTYGQKRLETTLMPYFTEEPMTLAASFAPSDLRQTLIIFTDDPAWDTIYPALKEADISLQAGLGAGHTLYEALITHTLYDDEELTLSTSFGTATLTATTEHIITHDLYDTENMTMAADFKASGHTLVVVLIDHVLYDKESMKLAATFGTGGTLV